MDSLGFGPFRLDADTGTLVRDGELLGIGQRGARLLEALLRAGGQVVTKADLMEAAWPGIAVEESNLSVQIAALRKALGPSADGGEWIATVPRVGYRFMGAVMLASPQATESAIGAVMPSLAVLPFQNLSGNAEQDYFADGIVEDIITALSRFRSLAVIARNSTFAYKGRSIDVRQVAKELGVRYVLEGSVRRAEDRLRISAQLVDGTSGAHLWADRFDGTVHDVFDVQDRITESVVSIVEPQIREAEITRSRRERPGSVAAYDLYLRAQPKLRAVTPDENAAGYALLAQAIALEPNNGVLLGKASSTLEHRVAMGWPSLTDNDRGTCLNLAHRALANAGEDASVLADCALGLISAGREYDFGMATIRRAIEANPNHFIVVMLAGIANLHCGSLDDALAYFDRALRLSPADSEVFFALTGVAHVQMILGRYAEALATAERSLTFNPRMNATFWMLIAANAHLGRTEEARGWLTRFRAIAPGVTLAAIREGQPQKDAGRMAAILEGLRLAGLE